MNHKVSTLIVIVAVLLVLPVTGCGNKSLPNIPAAELKTDADIRAGEMKIYGILQSAGELLNDASALEAQLAASGVVNASAHQRIKAAFDAAAREGLAILTAIDTHALSSWAQVKARVDAYVTQLSALLPLVQPTGHPKLMAVVEVLAQLAVAVLQPGALGGGR